MQGKLLRWTECCGRCGGKSSVEMTPAGDGTSGCWLCGLSERWLEPSGEVVARGGNGCSWSIDGGKPSLSKGMSRRALQEEVRRYGVRMTVGMRASKKCVMTVSERKGAGRWVIRSAGSRGRGSFWVRNTRDAVVLSELLRRRAWSENLGTRLKEKRLAGTYLVAEFTRARLKVKVSSTAKCWRQNCESDDLEDWEDLPV
jgi:hypothetical protein